MTPIKFRSRKQRGFTITEILIASTLAMMFAALIGQVLSSTVRNTGDTLSRIEAETRAREVLRSTASNLRGAIPLGVCQEPAGEKDISKCLRVGSYPGSTAILSAGPDELEFWAYSKNEANNLKSSFASSAPSYMRVYIESEIDTTINKEIALLLVERLDAPTLKSYIDTPAGMNRASWNQSSKTRMGELSTATKTPITKCSTQKTQIFTYYDANGSELLPDIASCKLSNNQLINITLVEVDAEVLYRSRLGTNGTAPIKLKSAVSINSQLYAGLSG